MTKINTVDMVYHIPSNHNLIPSGSGIYNGNQPIVTYTNIPQISTYTTQTVTTGVNGKQYFVFDGTTKSIRSNTTVRYDSGDNIQFECDFILTASKRHVLYCVGSNATSSESASVFEVYVDNSINMIIVEIGTKIFKTTYSFFNNVEYNILVSITQDNGLLININGQIVSNILVSDAVNALNNINSGSYYHFIGSNSFSSTSNSASLTGSMTNVF